MAVDSAQVEELRERYRSDGVLDKIIDNKGNGFQELYGLRNMRPVLHGVMYRGGANNYYHRSSPRDNRNPLPDEGLENLCEEGFGTAVYLYKTRYDTAPQSVKCDSDGQSNRLDYRNLLYAENDDVDTILALIYDTILKDDAPPVYVHCWNGWHASGYVSAVALRQFCDYSGEQAVSYWDQATDGVNTNPRYQRIRDRIRQFEPQPERSLPPGLMAELCPAY